MSPVHQISLALPGDRCEPWFIGIRFSNIILGTVLITCHDIQKLASGQTRCLSDALKRGLHAGTEPQCISISC